MQREPAISKAKHIGELQGNAMMGFEEHISWGSGGCDGGRGRCQRPVQKGARPCALPAVLCHRHRARGSWTLGCHAIPNWFPLLAACWQQLTKPTGQCSSAGRARLNHNTATLDEHNQVFAFLGTKPDELEKVISRGRFLFCGQNPLMTCPVL